MKYVLFEIGSKNIYYHVDVNKHGIFFSLLTVARFSCVLRFYNFLEGIPSFGFIKLFMIRVKRGHSPIEYARGIRLVVSKMSL